MQSHHELTPRTWALMLKSRSSELWLQKVLDHFDIFLQDHATCERKASATCLGFVIKFKAHPKIVHALTDLAIEELEHFKLIKDILAAKNLEIGGDEKDQYVNEFLQVARNDNNGRMLDRLLIFGIVEARATERFGLIAKHHSDIEIKKIYHALATAEAKHQALFVDLALEFFPEHEVHSRLEDLLWNEAKILEKLPIQAKLH